MRCHETGSPQDESEADVEAQAAATEQADLQVVEPVAILFGLACLGAVALAMRSGSLAAVLSAWAMVSVWAAANLLWLHDASKLIPLIDLPMACAAFAVWYSGRKPWQRALLIIYVSRMVLHLTYPGSGEAGEIAYFHILNVSFLAALVAISWEGGINDAIGDCLRRVRRVRLLLAGDSSLARAEVENVGE